jgi:hypothetical protein
MSSYNFSMTMELRNRTVYMEGRLFSDDSVGIENELDDCICMDEKGNELKWDLTDDEAHKVVEAALKKAEAEDLARDAASMEMGSRHARHTSLTNPHGYDGQVFGGDRDWD